MNIDNTAAAESQDDNLDLLVYTQSFKANPKEYRKQVPEWLHELKTCTDGLIIVRDYPFNHGIDTLPRELAITIAEECNTFFIVGDAPALPIAELRLYDSDLGTELWRTDRGKRAVVFCQAEQIVVWRAFIAFYNRSAWVCVIDTEGSRIVKEGAPHKTPV